MRYLGVWLVFCVGAAWAEDKPAEKIPAELRSCVSIERNTERLACYDRGVAALLGASGAAAPSAESSFGLVASTPRTDAIRSPQIEEVLQKVTGKEASVVASGDG